MSTSAQLCLKWLWFRLTCLMIMLLGIGSFATKPPKCLIVSTQEVFSRRLKRPVSAEEAKEIIRSFSSFINLLKEVRYEPAK
jgi:hypothetical protein